ncbi:MAG: acetyl-CoA carboxylase biotin carboxyl carrier protein subunit [bacterium]
MEFDFTVGGKNYRIRLDKKESGFAVEVDGHQETVNATFIDANTISLILGRKTVTAYVAFDGDRIHVSVGGEKFQIEKGRELSLKDRFREGTGPAARERVISTPMPGQIVKIQVEQGEVVEANQNLFIVESMKMENQIKSPMRARVDKIHFKDGDAVDANAPIVELSAVIEEKNE